MEIEYLWDLIQGTDQWHKCRMGIFTASEMKNFLSATEIKNFTDAESLKVANNKDTRASVYQLAYERVTEYLDPQFESFAMERGTIEEAYAKNLYSKHYEQIKDCGFVINRSLGFPVGFSPDGMVGEKKQVECKSRKGNLQLQTIVEEASPVNVDIQIQTGLWVTGRDSCDFISYGNGMPMFVETIHPEEKAQNAIEATARVANERVEQTVEKFKKIVEERGLVWAPYRDQEDGTIMKPSHTDEPTDVYMAG